MGVEISKNIDANRYEIFLDGELAGFADYEQRSTSIVFPHTEIDPKFGGKGLGSKLIEFALNQVAAEGLSVVPLCPFVSAFIRKNPEKYLQLVPTEQREKFGL